jgi:glycosyltransferase involved in cell wall biosynthesis
MSKAVKPTIIFYGPLGGKQGKVIGGGESGNKRTVEILSGLEYPLIPLEKPYPPRRGNKLLRGIGYVSQLTGAYFKLIGLFLKVKGPKSLHISGFYEHLIYKEWLFVRTARLFGIHTVYEIRAGGLTEGYHQRGSLYRRFFDQTIKHTSVVLVQGAGYKDFILGIKPSARVYHYPNFIMNRFYARYADNNRTTAEQLALVYFGRITPSKNVAFIIDICARLQALYPHFTMDIIGAGDEHYLELLNAKIIALHLENQVRILPPMSTEALFEHLTRQHFFIFPSREKREGHSNALTEAMNAGVLPIVSDAGFNRTIVQNDAMVIEEFDDVAYAKKIVQIAATNQWSTYSHYVHEIVGRFYTENAVQETLNIAHTSHVQN